MYSLVSFVVTEIRFNYFLQLGICYMLQDCSYVQNEAVFFLDKSRNEAVMCIHLEIVDMTYELIEVGNLYSQIYFSSEYRNVLSDNPI